MCSRLFTHFFAIILTLNDYLHALMYIASPISGGGGDSHGSSQEVKKIAHQMAYNLRKVHAYF